MTINMKHISWHDRYEIACAHYHMYGVHVNCNDFDLDAQQSPLWDSFIALVNVKFAKINALNIMSSVINDDLMLFEKEEDAKILIDILQQDAYHDIYFSYIPVPPIIDMVWSEIIGK